MKVILLTKGQVAKVDDSDFEVLSQWEWYANWNHTDQKWHACRAVLLPSGKQIKVRMHRQIMGLEYKDGRLVDHRNFDTLDNQRENLRAATRTQNSHNRGMSKKNTTGFRGVSRAKRRGKTRWVAQIKVDGKTRHLGYFSTPELAYERYREEALRLRGEFANV